VYRTEENMCTVQKKTKAMLVASKAIGLEVTAEKTKYMVMPREKNAKKIRTIKRVNKFFEYVPKSSKIWERQGES